MSRDKIANHALVSGLCPLIPLPFVDDWALARVRRGLYGSLAGEVGVTLSPAALDALSAGPRTTPLGCLLTLLIWPVKKLFKTLLVFLLIKECLDVATETLHRGEMVKMAAEAGHLQGDVAPVRGAMDQTLGALSISPVSRLLLLRQRPALPERVPPAPGYGLRGLAGRLQVWGGGGIVLREFERALAAMAVPPREEPTP